MPSDLFRSTVTDCHPDLEFASAKHFENDCKRDARTRAPTRRQIKKESVIESVNHFLSCDRLSEEPTSI